MTVPFAPPAKSAPFSAPQVTACGPVLSAEPEAAAVLAALRELNEDLRVVDRGTYLRVTAPGRCVLTAASVTRHLGRPFLLPGSLEKMMPSFTGVLTIANDTATWTVPEAEDDPWSGRR
jgi:hypothetical protein